MKNVKKIIVLLIIFITVFVGYGAIEQKSMAASKKSSLSASANSVAQGVSKIVNKKKKTKTNKKKKTKTNKKKKTITKKEINKAIKKVTKKVMKNSNNIVQKVVTKKKKKKTTTKNKKATTKKTRKSSNTNEPRKTWQDLDTEGKKKAWQNNEPQKQDVINQVKGSKERKDNTIREWKAKQGIPEKMNEKETIKFLEKCYNDSCDRVKNSEKYGKNNVNVENEKKSINYYNDMLNDIYSEQYNYYTNVLWIKKLDKKFHKKGQKPVYDDEYYDKISKKLNKLTKKFGELKTAEQITNDENKDSSDKENKETENKETKKNKNKNKNKETKKNKNNNKNKKTKNNKNNNKNKETKNNKNSNKNKKAKNNKNNNKNKETKKDTKQVKTLEETKKERDEMRKKYPELNSNYQLEGLNKAPRLIIDENWTPDGKNTNKYFAIKILDGEEIVNVKENINNKDGKNTKKTTQKTIDKKTQYRYLKAEDFGKEKEKVITITAKDKRGLEIKRKYKVKYNSKNGEFEASKSARVHYSYKDGKLNIILTDYNGIANDKAELEIIDKNTNKTIEKLTAKELKEKLKLTTKNGEGNIVDGMYPINLKKLTAKNGKYVVKVKAKDGKGTSGNDMIEFTNGIKSK